MWALPHLAPVLLLQSRLEGSAVWGLRNLRATWAYSLLTRAMSREELGSPWIRLWRKCGGFWMTITYPKCLWCASLDWISWLIPISLEKAGATQWLGNGWGYRSGSDANALLPTLSEFKISLNPNRTNTPNAVCSAHLSVWWFSWGLLENDSQDECLNLPSPLRHAYSRGHSHI